MTHIGAHTTKTMLKVFFQNSLHPSQPSAGRNLSLWVAAVLFGLVCSRPLAADSFSSSGGLQTFTVSASGVYDITAYGAQGGSSANGPTGGKGAEIGGDFALTAGEILQLYVGGAGGAGMQIGTEPSTGGGGGGTFIVGPGNTPLVVAGGGGGAGLFLSGIGGYTTSSGSGGGESGPYGSGGGGGGFTGNGQDNSSFVGGGGKGFPVLTGGTPGSGNAGAGGFGGGGGGGLVSGGGGGGYSGGVGGSDTGGGGGSYLDPSAFETLLTAGANGGDGSVDITLVSVATPEPDSLLLLGFGLVGISACSCRVRRHLSGIKNKFSSFEA